MTIARTRLRRARGRGCRRAGPVPTLIPSSNVYGAPPASISKLASPRGSIAWKRFYDGRRQRRLTVNMRFCEARATCFCSRDMAGLKLLRCRLAAPQYCHVPAWRDR